MCRTNKLSIYHYHFKNYWGEFEPCLYFIQRDAQKLNHSKNYSRYFIDIFISMQYFITCGNINSGLSLQYQNNTKYRKGHNDPQNNQLYILYIVYLAYTWQGFLAIFLKIVTKFKDFFIILQHFLGLTGSRALHNFSQ